MTVNKIFANDIRENIFEIIDFTNFTNEIKSTNESLSTDRFLPNVEIDDLIDLSKVITYKNRTHAQISIEIPIISTRSSSLFEIIPIPFLKNGKTNIFDMNSELFLKNKRNETFIVPERSLLFEIASK